MSCLFLEKQKSQISVVYFSLKGLYLPIFLYAVVS